MQKRILRKQNYVYSTPREPTFAHSYFFTFFSIWDFGGQIASFQTSGGVPGEDFDA